jgi:hypothetical protein
MQAKHIIGDFEGFSKGSSFFDPQIVLNEAKSESEKQCTVTLKHDLTTVD